MHICVRILTAIAVAAPCSSTQAQDIEQHAATRPHPEADATESASLLRASPHEVIGVPEALRPILEQDFEAWANPYGGARRDMVYTGLLQLGLQADLEKAGWVPGLSMGAVGVWVQGRNISSTAVGDAGIISNIAGVETVRLFKLWLRQRFWDGVLDIKAGLIPADDDFMVVDSALLFIHSSFGTLQSTALNIPVGIYPLAALGFRAVVQPHPAWQARVGIYDGDAGVENVDRHVSDLALTADQGATLFGEVTWHGRLYDLPSRATLGGFAHLGLLHDHLNLFRDFNEARRQRGLGNVYVMLEQDLAHWRNSTLTASAHAAIAFPERRAVVPGYFDVALVLGGGGWSRPSDRVGLGYAWTGFGDAYLKNERSLGRSVSASESVLELTYRLGVLPWVHLQPTVQWLFDPHFSQRDALVLGLRVSVEV